MNSSHHNASNPGSENYGDVPLEELKSFVRPESKWSNSIKGKEWTQVRDLAETLKDQEILIRARIKKTRSLGRKITFVVVRQKYYTVQCVVSVDRNMVKYASSLTSESIVDVIGLVRVPRDPIEETTQKVEVHVHKIYCISRSIPILPFTIEDASRSESQITKALEEGKQLARVNQDTRLNHRFLDLRTAANQCIFIIKGEVEDIFGEYLKVKGFTRIGTSAIQAGSSEGGSAVFKFDYKGQPACLAQSPQLHKQMAISGDFGNVFEVFRAFRAEDSYTHRHLCEFTSMDVEMEIMQHYSEVMDLVDKLFVTIFDTLNERCKVELEVVAKQYPFEPLKYKPKTLRLAFEEGIQMLKDAGIEIDPLGDLNTEAERKLGQLVLEKYDTEFYILHRYPLAARPFYTMPCGDNPLYSSSFDAFIRGEEIISGAQRIHDPELLTERAQACGIDVKTISEYIDSFRCGAPLHGGFGAGLERVVMLFLGLDNIRKTSLFPRDPRRLVP